MSDEGYIDVHPDAVFDDFSVSGSEPLTARAGWSRPPVAVIGVIVLEADIPAGHALHFDWAKLLPGGVYGVSVRDGVETWWEKVDGLWTRRE